MPINGPLFNAVVFPMFQRAMRNILSITQASPAVVTTTYDGINPGENQYSTGMIVRIVIPVNFGMQQLNEQLVNLTVIDESSFFINVDTTNYDAFVIPTYGPQKNGTPAQVIPVGQENHLLINATQNVLPTGKPVN